MTPSSSFNPDNCTLRSMPCSPWFALMIKDCTSIIEEKTYQKPQENLSISFQIRARMFFLEHKRCVVPVTGVSGLSESKLDVCMDRRKPEDGCSSPFRREMTYIH